MTKCAKMTIYNDINRKLLNWLFMSTTSIQLTFESDRKKCNIRDKLYWKRSQPRLNAVDGVQKKQNYMKSNHPRRRNAHESFRGNDCNSNGCKANITAMAWRDVRATHSFQMPKMLVPAVSVIKPFPHSRGQFGACKTIMTQFSLRTWHFLLLVMCLAAIWTK